MKSCQGTHFVTSQRAAFLSHLPAFQLMGSQDWIKARTLRAENQGGVDQNWGNRLLNPNPTSCSKDLSDGGLFRTNWSQSEKTNIPKLPRWLLYLPLVCAADVQIKEQMEYKISNKWNKRNKWSHNNIKKYALGLKNRKNWNGSWVSKYW